MGIINILYESDILPLELKMVKVFLKVDYEEENENEDIVILRAFKAAIKQCETIINKSLIEKKYLFSIYEHLNSNFIQLLYGNTKDIEEIKIITANNQEIIIDQKNYFLDKVSDKIIFNSNLINFYRLDIKYSAICDNITDELIQAILFHTTKIYEDKVGYSQIPRASYNIYKKYKNVKI